MEDIWTFERRERGGKKGRGERERTEGGGGREEGGGEGGGRTWEVRDVGWRY